MYTFRERIPSGRFAIVRKFEIIYDDTLPISIMEHRCIKITTGQEN